MKTIMFVECGRSGYGGSFHSLYHTVVNLNPEKYRFVVVFFNKTIFYEKLTKCGIKCYYLNDPIYENCFTYKKFLLLKLNGFVLRYFSRLSVLIKYIVHLKTIHNMESIIRKEGVGLIHLNNQLSLNYMGLFSAKSTGIPCVVHLRTFNSGGLNSYKIAFATDIIRKYIAISKEIKYHWVDRGLDTKNIDVIYNILTSVQGDGMASGPVSLSSFCCGLKIIYVGRLIECKGVQFLLECFAQLANDNINNRLFLVGDGEYEGKTRELVSLLNIEDSVVFLGFRENPRPFIKQADLLVLPSKEEGFGRVLLEAMDVGTPVIGTRVGGIPEIVEHGVNGLLVNYGDVKSLNDSILKILKDGPFRDKLIRGGYETIRNKFRPDIYQRKLENIYDSLLLD